MPLDSVSSISTTDSADWKNKSQIEVNQIKFTQDSIARNFQDGKPVLSGAHIEESIRITEKYNGDKYTLDNRRLYAKKYYLNATEAEKEAMRNRNPNISTEYSAA